MLTCVALFGLIFLTMVQHLQDQLTTIKHTARSHTENNKVRYLKHTDHLFFNVTFSKIINNAQTRNNLLPGSIQRLQRVVTPPKRKYLATHDEILILHSAK